jgi:hypothetical protein
MATGVPRWLVEFILLGPEDDRRQLQDSPILGDVWFEFAKQASGGGDSDALELLITPYKDNAAGRVASTLTMDCKIRNADIAHLQGIVAAKLKFEDVLRYVVPLTKWWSDRRVGDEVGAYVAKPAAMRKDFEKILTAAYQWKAKHREPLILDLGARKRYIALAGLVLRSRDPDFSEALTDTADEDRIRKVAEEIVQALGKIMRELYAPKAAERGLIWTVALNRRASPALTRSVPSVKADAARTLFTVDCSQIVWAVIDSGIEAAHPAFLGKDGRPRVRKSFDFTQIRTIVSVDNLTDADKRKERVKKLLSLPKKGKVKPADAEKMLGELADDARRGRSIDWEMAEKLIEIEPATPPHTNHGTHVAGIIGAKKAAPPPAAAANKLRRGKTAAATREVDSDEADGMCPDIGLFDFRVLGRSLMETEFAIIAALQYIRYINDRNSWFTVHGANLSLSIPHDVRNYACGRTPICRECERLVDSGVVVVAAAGNRGYQNFETKEGLYEGYAAFSITDPGNAEGVITVGATHRYWPHTYGVSFFSSRGPTGDGRTKPDLVAPGERIRAPVPGPDKWGDLDGTSMAAPHVSGAAAMLMARYSELVGQPRRIKAILCESATDLGRDKSFQGHGMLDVLRAFQSI